MVPYSQEEMLERLRSLLESAPKNINGKLIDNHIVLNIAGNDVHYWSPQLNFRVEKHEQDPSHSVISGLIGPRPAVWTLFMFIYFSVGIVGFFISSFGLSKWLLGEYSHLLLAFPIAVLFMLTAYLTGRYGKKLAKDQIVILKQFVRDAVNLEKD
ncbi:hypothetical protein FNH22_21700 [Fulvivirga sp. M361]|nr:hypothetical protein FNH22_21700 [Fulvivirga sp. M361]